MFDKLLRDGRLPKDQAAKYFQQTCEALAFLHSQPVKVIYRGIMPENILLTGLDDVKLADCPMAAELLWWRFTHGIEVPSYLAPEMIRNEGYDESVDMWGCGVLLYEMLTGTHPFKARTDRETVRRILRAEMLFPGVLSSDSRELIGKLCRRLPQWRLKATEALRLSHQLLFSHRSSINRSSINRSSINRSRINRNRDSSSCC